MERRGAVHPALIVLGVLALVAMIFYAAQALGEEQTSPEISNSRPFGDSIGVPQLNFLSFIIGEIPEFLIDWTNPYSAAIVMISLFMILLFVFSDIITTFGTFSNQYISWFVGSALAIIAANLKAVMWIAVLGFSAASFLGVFSVVVGVGAPFVIYLVIHFMLFKNLQGWVRGKKDAAAFRTGVDELKTGMEGIKEFGKAMKS